MDAGDWDRRWIEKRCHEHGDVPSTVVVAEVDALPPARALDLACGAGRHAIWLAKRGWRVTAVDFSSEALRQARERAETAGVDVDWIEADLVSYTPPQDSFDLVLLAYVHVPEDELVRVLGAASAALAPGGTLVFVGHDRANLETGAPGPRAPDLLHGSRDIARELRSLAISRAGQIRRPVELEDGSLVDAVDALVVATRQ